MKLNLNPYKGLLKGGLQCGLSSPFIEGICRFGGFPGSLPCEGAASSNLAPSVLISPIHSQ